LSETGLREPEIQGLQGLQRLGAPETPENAATKQGDYTTNGKDGSGKHVG